MYFSQLVQSKKSVFTMEELATLWGISSKTYLKVIAHRLFKSGKVIRIQRGIYALKRDVDAMEIANKLTVPSYVSLETVLARSGVIFQDYDNITFSVARNTVTKENTFGIFRYYKIRDDILTNPMGIIFSGNVAMATPERAVCDRLYLSPQYYFDNVRMLDVERLRAIAQMYNKRVQKDIKQLIIQKDA